MSKIQIGAEKETADKKDGKQLQLDNAVEISLRFLSG